jgi:hypothetical protein
VKPSFYRCSEAIWTPIGEMRKNAIIWSWSKYVVALIIETIERNRRIYLQTDRNKADDISPIAVATGPCCAWSVEGLYSRAMPFGCVEKTDKPPIKCSSCCYNESKTSHLRLKWKTGRWYVHTSLSEGQTSDVRQFRSLAKRENRLPSLTKEWV